MSLRDVILFALEREAAPLLRRLRGLGRIRSAPCPAWEGAAGVLVLRTGMGAEATARALDWLFQRRPMPRRVVSAGFCGSLVPELGVGILVQPSEIVSLGGDSSWPVASEGTIAHAGRLVSVERPVMGREARSQLHQETGSIVVDMESATAARLCGQAGVPLMALRAVSDAGEGDLPADLGTALEGEQVRVRPLIRAILRRPGLVRDLWRLARDTRLAGEVLAEGLVQLLRRPLEPSPSPPRAGRV